MFPSRYPYHGRAWPSIPEELNPPFMYPPLPSVSSFLPPPSHGSVALPPPQLTTCYSMIPSITLTPPEPPKTFDLSLRKYYYLGTPVWVPYTLDICIPDAQLQEIVTCQKGFRAMSVNDIPLASLSPEARKLTASGCDMVTIKLAPAPVGVTSGVPAIDQVTSNDPYQKLSSSSLSCWSKEAKRVPGYGVVPGGGGSDEVTRQQVEKRIAEHWQEICRLQTIIDTHFN